ncbi:MAG: hypothetical protein ACRDQE_08285 [Gaiellales bacterium]
MGIAARPAATEVDDAELKADPRDVVNAVAPEAASTGEVVAVARIPDRDISLSVLAVDELDVEERRGGRWRIRPTLQQALPAYLAGLTSGRQNGVGPAP